MRRTTRVLPFVFVLALTVCFVGGAQAVHAANNVPAAVQCPQSPHCWAGTVTLTEVIDAQSDEGCCVQTFKTTNVTTVTVNGAGTIVEHESPTGATVFGGEVGKGSASLDTENSLTNAHCPPDGAAGTSINTLVGSVVGDGRVLVVPNDDEQPTSLTIAAAVDTNISTTSTENCNSFSRSTMSPGGGFSTQAVIDVPAGWDGLHLHDTYTEPIVEYAGTRVAERTVTWDLTRKARPGCANTSFAVTCSNDGKCPKPKAQDDDITIDPTGHHGDIIVTRNDTPAVKGCTVHVESIEPSTLGARVLPNGDGKGVVYVAPHKAGLDTFQYKIVGEPGTSSIATVHVHLKYCRTVTAEFRDLASSDAGSGMKHELAGSVRLCFDGGPPEIQGAPKLTSDTATLVNLIPFADVTWKIPLVSHSVGAGTWQFAGEGQECFDFTGLATKPRVIAKAIVKKAAALLAAKGFGDLAADTLNEFDALIPKACLVVFDPRITVVASKQDWSVNFSVSKSAAHAGFIQREVQVGAVHNRIKQKHVNITYSGCSPWHPCTPNRAP